MYEKYHKMYQLGATISIGTLPTITESFTVGGTTEVIKSLVRSNSGFTWSKSLTRSVTTTHKSPSSKVGYVAFKPYYRKVIGTVSYGLEYLAYK